MAILIGDLILGRSSWSWLPYLAVSGLLTSVIVLFLQWDTPDPIGFLGGFNADNLSIVFRAIVALSTAITILMSIRYVEQSGTSLAEFIGILLTATLGGMFLCGANELGNDFRWLGNAQYFLLYVDRIHEARSSL